MLLTELEVVHFRNLADARVQVAPGLNIVVGRNASGKTSLLEAIGVLSDGQSFRTPRIAELVTWQEQSGLVKGAIEQDGLIQVQEVRIVGKQRILYRDGKVVPKLLDYLGGLPYVLFTAEHLGIVQAGPEARRGFIDRALLQLYPRYLEVYRTYQRILDNRNMLLRSPTSNPDELAAWTFSLAAAGAEIMKRRFDYLRLLVQAAAQHHTALAVAERLGLAYKFSMGASFGEGEEVTRDRLGALMVEAIAKTKDLERRRGLTMIGPHRDDIIIQLNGRSLRSFGSRGQQRSAVLALKLGELDLFKRIQGSYPVLVLDDVTAELDEERCKDFLLAIAGDIQSFISTTDYGKIMRLLGTSKVFLMENGGLKVEAE